MDSYIDKIGFYTSKQYTDMNTVGGARDVDPNKYINGLGQEETAVVSEVDDAVTMAAQTTWSILNDTDKKAIDMMLVGSEFGVDNSKSIAVWVHELTGINKRARAVVMVVAKDPSIATINNNSATYTKSIPDFWRPLHCDYAMVDGHYFNSAYLDFLGEVWGQCKVKTGLSTKDFKTILLNTPFTKMGKKALNKLAEVEKTVKLNVLCFIMKQVVIIIKISIISIPDHFI